MLSQGITGEKTNYVNKEKDENRWMPDFPTCRSFQTQITKLSSLNDKASLKK